jgi:hypothetical protein
VAALEMRAVIVAGQARNPSVLYLPIQLSTAWRLTRYRYDHCRPLGIGQLDAADQSSEVYRYSRVSRILKPSRS